MTDILNIPVHTEKEPDIYTMFSDIVKIAGVTYGKELFFTFGPRKEIIENLVSMSKNNTTSLKKYPMIAISGIPTISVGEWNTYGDLTCDIIIATLSDINTKAEQRNEQKYVSILRPLYTVFIDSIYKSNLFDTFEPKLKHDLLDRFDIAKGKLQFDGLASPDFIDAIEIKNLKLKIKN